MLASRNWRRLSVGAGTACIVIGVLVCIGWVFDVHALKGFYAGITMKPNAAICLVLAGVSVVLLNVADVRIGRYPVVTLLASATALIGGLTLVQHLTGVGFGIDQLLFNEAPGEPATTSPGRMGPNASISFLLCGIALVCLQHRRAIAAAQLAAALVSFSAVLALTGYAYGARTLYGVAQYTGIALHTAVALLLLAVAILAARARDGIMETVSAPDAAGLVIRRLLLWVVALPFGLGWAALTGLRTGLFDMAFGTALLVLILIATFIGVVWSVGRRLAMLQREGERSSAALRETEERFRVLANEAPVLIWISSSTGSRLWFNRAWLQFTGRAMESESATGWLDRLHEEDRGRYLAAYRTAIEQRQPFSIEFRIQRADGAYRWVLETAALRTSSSGEFAGYAASCVDITDRKSVEHERDALLESERVARSELERAARLKDEFLATLSHELRTPLNAMLGWIQVLRKTPADPATIGKGLHTIERNIRLQSQLIDDLLDMSRILSGKLRLEMREIELPAVIEAAIDTVRPAAQAKNIDIVVAIESPADRVLGDAHRLQQIVWNLLSNAIKFTPADGRVRIALDRIDHQARLVVEDNGKGLDPKFIPYLFERFRQADSSPSRDFGGLGLGLSIVKHLAELHGGTVHAESEGAGKGTRFTIYLPLADDTQTAHAQPSPLAMLDGRGTAYTPSELARIKVLVVDDNDDARDLVQRILVDCGANALTAVSADEAHALLRDQRPDVIISDIGMPRKDGYQFMLELRRAGITVPAIALTAFARAEDRTRALVAGYQMHIAKPVEAVELIDAVASLARTLQLVNGDTALSAPAIAPGPQAKS